MLDPSRTNSSPGSFERRSLDFQENLHGGSSRRRNRPPLRHQSAPLSCTKAIPNCRRASSRNNKHSSSRKLMMNAALGKSDSSLKFDVLSHETSKAAATGATPVTSSTILESLSSSWQEQQPSMDRRKSEVKMSHHRPSRVAELRLEMRKTASLRNHSSFSNIDTSASDETASNSLTQTPQQSHNSKGRRTLRRSKSEKQNTDNLWSRSLGSPLKRRQSEASRKPANSGGPTPPVQGKIGGSMRNILRHKRKLEKELNTSDVFHYVLHKAPLAQKPDAQESNSGDSSASSRSKPKVRLSFDRFLTMKQRSEKMAQSTTGEPCDSRCDLSKSLSHIDSLSEDDVGRKNLEFDTNLNPSPEEDDDINEGESAVIMDFQKKVNTRPLKRDSNSRSASASHALSIDTDDFADLGESSKVLEATQEHINEHSITDPAGREGIYTGLISTASGMPNGRGRLLYVEEQKIFEGDFVHGHWAGHGRCLDLETGEDYQGTFHDSLKHGHGVSKYKDGSTFEGTYHLGVWQRGMMTYTDGSTYMGDWSDGLRSGTGTYTFVNGSMYIGDFADDKMHGHGILVWFNGLRFDGSWANGLRHGTGTETLPNGSMGRQGVWNEGSFVA